MENKEQQTKQNIMQVIKFTLFSISAGIIQVVSFIILKELLPFFGTGEYGFNYFISLLLSVLWNFTFNRKYTFKADGNVKKAMLLVLLFYVVFTPISIFGGQALVNAGTGEYIVLAITMISNFVLEFLYTKFIVYKEAK